ncbi:hypothetical protein [Bacillus subtilis]|uniref:hypothetical protein n=1 Tax=Bacillus subtilis TaxID=1423 RepID=UPI002DB8C2A6|nr:hypothetical protein [Bacillus subtilis]MEC0392844.1 hypothetical protein [Bacillus subtilis]MEC4002915.1 hypothetical protein [Bacillus subtilis]
MKLIYKYDSNLNYMPLENTVISNNDPIPKGYTDIPPTYPDGTGMYKPVFDKNKLEWRETATQEYIDSLQPPNSGPSPIDLFKKQNALLSLQIARLQADVEALKGGGAL